MWLVYVDLKFNTTVRRNAFKINYNAREIVATNEY